MKERKKPVVVKRSTTEKFLSKVKDQDTYGQSMQLQLDEGKQVLKSMIGSICTLIIFVIVLGYMYLKIDVLISKKDIDILSTVEEFHYDADYVFDYSKGFNLAVALTSYSSLGIEDLDDSIGRIVFKHYYWGSDAESVFETGRTPIDSHICSEDELGLNGREESKFLPIDKNNKADVKIFSN